MWSSYNLKFLIMLFFSKIYCKVGGEGKHAEVKINYKHHLQMLLKLGAKRHSKCKWPRGRKHHAGRIVNSCLELCQHFPHSSAPGLSMLLSLPLADELLLWEYHHWQEKPVVLGPAADSVGNFWRSGDWC